MDNNRDSLSGGNMGQAQLPNATAVLVLGILSIVICFICGIIALVMANKDMALYKNNPGLYTEASYNNIKAGRICAIIGIALQAVAIIVYILIIAVFVSAASAGSFR
jgi:M penetrans paralogue family 26